MIEARPRAEPEIGARDQDVPDLVGRRGDAALDTDLEAGIRGLADDTLPPRLLVADGDRLLPPPGEVGVLVGEMRDGLRAIPR